MKQVIVVVAAVLVAGCSVTPPGPEATPAPSSSASPSSFICVEPSDPNSHVYHPDRLKVIQPCVTATGTIAFERPEKDGDYHIGLKVDPAFADLPNDCNATCLGGAEHGDLILEPVCELPVTQADAVSACAGYHNPLVIPPVGTHVSATGPLVLDLDHGWNEIHSLQAIRVIS